MVEPLDDRGIRTLTRVRPIKREERLQRQRRREKEVPEEAAAEPQGKNSRVGRNIDEHC